MNSNLGSSWHSQEFACTFVADALEAAKDPDLGIEL